MSLKQTIDFSNDRHVYFNLASTRYDYKISIDGVDKEVEIVFSKSYFKELVEKFIDEEIIQLSEEDNEIIVEV